LIQAVLQLSPQRGTRRIAYRTFVLFAKATALKVCDACLLSKMLFAKEPASLWSSVDGKWLRFCVNQRQQSTLARELDRCEPFQGRQDIRQCLARFIPFQPRRLYPRSSESDFVARSRQPLLHMNDFVCSFHQMVVVLAC